MEFNNRTPDNRPSHQSPSYGYFSEQARRAGSMGSYLGRFHHEHLQNQNFHPHPQPLPHQHPHLHHHPPLQPDDLHEAIQREVEKQRIREEIIISEIARRRILEAEVRRELMMERELALQRGDDGFPFGPSSRIGYKSTARLPVLGMRGEGRSLEDWSAIPYKDREWQNGLRGNGELEILPFQRRSTEPTISEVTPLLEGGKEREKIISPPKPAEKRKAASSAVDDSKLPTAAILRKKAKEELCCAICEVIATSEKTLKDHLEGRKHKAALRAQKVGKNFSIGLFPKKAALSAVGAKTLDSAGEKSETQSLNPKKTEERSSKENGVPMLRGKRQLKRFKSTKSKAQEEQDDGNSNKKKYRFWCEMCQVGAYPEKVFDAHRQGKKHVKRELYQSGAASKSLKKKAVAQDDTKVGDGKNTVVEIAGDSTDAVTPEGYKTVDEAKADDDKAIEAAGRNGEPEDNKDPIVLQYSVAKPEDNEDNEEVVPKSNMAVDATEPADNEADAGEPGLTEAMDAGKPGDG